MTTSRSSNESPYAARRARRAARAGSALWLTALGAMPLAQPGADDMGRPARPGDLALGIRLNATDATITAYEPVLADIDIRNRAAERIRVCVAHAGGGGLSLEVRDIHGEVVGTMPPHGESRDGHITLVPLDPDGTYTVRWAANAMYQFAQPGEYDLRLRLTDPLRGGLVLAETHAPLFVRAFDPGALEARCEATFAPIRENRSSRTDLSLAARVRILRSIRHDIALPYLDWMAREWADGDACLAIRRIGTDRAQRTIKALERRQDRVGEAARRSAQRRLRPTMWDVMCE